MTLSAPSLALRLVRVDRACGVINRRTRSLPANVVRVRRHTDRTKCVVREGENKVPSPKTDLAASLTRIPDVGAGAFALW
jgi:hypothetical protein